MKKWLMGITLCLMLVAICNAESAPQIEWRVSGDYVIPGQDDDWDKAYGASVQFIYWKDTQIGLGLSLGFQKWEVNDEIYTYSEYLGSGIGYGYAAGLEGDALMIPLGASVLYKMAVWPKSSLALEGGLRYVLVNSSVKYEEAEALADTYGNYILDGASFDIDLGNGLVGVIGANFDYELSPGFRVFVGAAYQFDLIKGKTEANGVYINYDNELKAALIQGGIVWDWPVQTTTSRSAYSSMPTMQYEARQLAKEQQKAPAMKVGAERKAFEQKLAGEKQSPQPSAKPSPKASSSSDETVTSLKQLKSLRDEGILTEEEYETRRKSLVEDLFKDEANEPVVY